MESCPREAQERGVTPTPTERQEEPRTQRLVRSHLSDIFKITVTSAGAEGQRQVRRQEAFIEDSQGAYWARWRGKLR